MADKEEQFQIRLELINYYPQENAQDLAMLLLFLDNQNHNNQATANMWLSLKALSQSRCRAHLRAYTDEIIRQERERRMNQNRSASDTAESQDEGFFLN